MHERALLAVNFLSKSFKISLSALNTRSDTTSNTCVSTTLLTLHCPALYTSNDTPPKT